MTKCVQITTYGEVQNVGFRYNTQKIAKEYNISGYVRNLVDGTVFIEAEGEESDVEKFINWCKKGPERAIVEDIKVVSINSKGYSQFEIK